MALGKNMPSNMTVDVYCMLLLFGTLSGKEITGKKMNIQTHSDNLIKGRKKMNLAQRFNQVN